MTVICKSELRLQGRVHSPRSDFTNTKLTGLPSLIEPWLQRAIEAQQRVPALAGDRLDPVSFMPTGAVGPNHTSADVSGFVTNPFFWLPMLGNYSTVWSSERV